MIEKGSIIEKGDPRYIINHYLSKLIPSNIEKVPLGKRTDRSGNGKIKLTSFHIEDPEGNELRLIRSGMDVVFTFGFISTKENNLKNVDIGFSIYSEKGQTLFVLYSSYVGQIFDLKSSAGYFHCYIPQIQLSKGHYRVGARITIGGEEADWPRDGVGYIEIEEGDFYGTGRRGFEGKAPFLINGKWDIRNANESATEIHV